MGKAREMRDDGQETTPEVLRDLIAVAAGVMIPGPVIATWTPAERREAEEWAASEHLRASDNAGVKVPPQPGFVARAVEMAGNPAVAQLAVESWTWYLEALQAAEPGVRSAEFLNGAGEASEAARDAITGLLVLLKDAGQPGQFTSEQMTASYNAGHVKARQDAAAEEPQR